MVYCDGLRLPSGQSSSKPIENMLCLIPDIQKTLRAEGCKPSLTLDILHHCCGVSSLLPALLMSLASHTLSEGFSNYVIQRPIAAGLPSCQLGMRVSAGCVCRASRPRLPPAPSCAPKHACTLTELKKRVSVRNPFFCFVLIKISSTTHCE